MVEKISKEKSQGQLLDILKYPIITDKSTRNLEQNQYSFVVTKKATKPEIKQAIELFFNVKVEKVNTLIQPIRKKRLGRTFGYKPQFKKAIVKLAPDNKINLFEEE
jgi:large subunit ribosomal protein L23